MDYDDEKASLCHVDFKVMAVDVKVMDAHTSPWVN